MKKESNQKVQKQQPKSNVVAASIVAAPPAAGAPEVPKGFVKPATGRGPRLAIWRGQIALGSQVQKELLSATPADFGPYAPDLPTLAANVAVGSEWSEERIKAVAWSEFARAQEVAAWEPALATFATLLPAFEYAMSRDPSVAERFPALARFFGLRKKAGVKGAKSRNRPAKTSSPAKAAPAAPAAPAADSQERSAS